MLVCDGVSLIDVAHDEAGEAFKRAMDSHSVSEQKILKIINIILCYGQGSIDLVVAVNPEP